MSRLLSAKGGCRGRQYAGYARQLHGAAARGSYARRLHEAATRATTPGGYTATINRYAAADACARTTPTEACVKQHLGAVAETGEEGARLLPPQLFQACRYFSPRLFQACRHVSPRPPFGNTGGPPPQNSLLCSLPFDALSLQADGPTNGFACRASGGGFCS